jgi:hypothetical protein
MCATKAARHVKADVEVFFLSLCDMGNLTESTRPWTKELDAAFAFLRFQEYQPCALYSQSQADAVCLPQRLRR